VHSHAVERLQAEIVIYRRQSPALKCLSSAHISSQHVIHLSLTLNLTVIELSLLGIKVKGISDTFKKYEENKL